MRLVCPLALLLGSVIFMTPLLNAQVQPGPFTPAAGWNTAPGYSNNNYSSQANSRQPRQSIWGPGPQAAAQPSTPTSSNFQYPSSLLEPFRANMRPASYAANNYPSSNGWQDPTGNLNPPFDRGQIQPQSEQLPSLAPNNGGPGMQPSAPGTMGWSGDGAPGQAYGYANQGPYGYGNGGMYGGYPNQYADVGQSYFQPGCGDGCVGDSCCGDVACCAPQGYWFGGFGGLIMYRDYESNVYLSYWPSDPRNNVMTSRDAEVGPMGGYEASIGHTMCNCWSWMATFWGIVPDSQTASVGGMPLTRLMGLSYLTYTPAGFGADNVFNWYDAASNHRITRENEFYNIELNFFRGSSTGCGTDPCCGLNSCGGATDCCPPTNCCGPAWNLQWLAGIRYFRFDEYFQYASSVGGGYTFAPRELYYDLDTENNLFGFQIGGIAQRSFLRCWSLYAGTKLGIYNNRINYYSRIYGASGDAIVNTGSYTGSAYNVYSNKDDLSFLGELNVGVRYQFARCWRATLGYRAIAATGIALAPEQIPYNFSYMPGVRYIDSDSSLILHGAYAGIEFRW